MGERGKWGHKPLKGSLLLVPAEEALDRKGKRRFEVFSFHVSQFQVYR
jgi:hypothetical protein